ncbi:Rieske 2Fe-2S family protein [Mumia flava]|uniref:Rieske 2Fe-2S family protein n=1 Tax=Mumia flava TaxID=1348852 RepID=A0A0B2BTW3_9ACTN|nr:aromatic ring-hydroxylating dioxygenase subunit alpha [Mumia flava]PJJ57986.1 Rieske 2Fe-2S family protein [Mumia flava]
MIIEPVARPLPGSLEPTLPGRWYTDPTIFAREQAAILEASWSCVVRSADIARPGDWEVATVGREQVIVSRNRRGEVRAFLNVCRHRGMRVCTEPSGSSRSLQCGYHAWTYDLDGRLVAAPNLTRMPDVDGARYGLVGVHVREWLGYVWVCLAAEPPSFSETVLGEVVTRLGDVRNLDNYGVDGIALGRRITYDVAANWKLVIENFQECYHCATIHPELTEVLPEFAEGWAAQAYVNHGAAFGDEVQGFTVDGSAGTARLPSVAAEQDRRYYAVTFRPNVFVNLVPDHVVLHRMVPLAVDRTRVVCDWLFAPEVVAAGTDVSASVELFHRVNVQDFDACEKTQPSMSSSAYAEGGVLVPAEHHIGEFHAWVRDAVGE